LSVQSFPLETQCRSSDEVLEKMPQFRILAIADWYLPGSKGGGSVSAISNLIALLGDEFEFYVFTRNHDSTENKPYVDICFEQWVQIGKAKAFYTSELSIQNILRCIREVNPQIIYLNSFFSPLTMKTLFLRMCGLLPRSAVVLAPRGEFSPGALELKSLRKWLYRKLAIPLGMYRDLLWQASSELEEEHIRRSSGGAGHGRAIKVLVAPDVPNASLNSSPCLEQRPKKNTGAVRFVFLSRVSQKKNLHFALDLLGSVQGDIELDIYGPIENRAYWEQCQDGIRRLPDRVRAHYKGPVSSDRVVQIFSQYHFQLFPTLGENFGYVILEALAGGCPVLISDQTPWRDLSKQGAGWDIPLNARKLWLDAIQTCTEMDQATYELFSRRSRTYFEKWMSATPYRLRAVELFEKALVGFSKPEVPRALERSVGAGH
jgi:glycosyltransferase involved in cell wall biosynthesis